MLKKKTVLYKQMTVNPRKKDKHALSPGVTRFSVGYHLSFRVQVFQHLLPWRSMNWCIDKKQPVVVMSVIFFCCCCQIVIVLSAL